MKYTGEKYRKLFTIPAEELAQWLLGKIICHHVHDARGDFIIRGRISVTEAYRETDNVTDAARKKWEIISQHKAGGHLYIKKDKRCKDAYRFDIVANREGVGEGVLIRGIDAYKEGPWIAAWALELDEQMDGVDLLDPKSEIWIETDNAKIIPNDPTPRKNLGKKASEESTNAQLRFTIKEIKFPE